MKTLTVDNFLLNNKLNDTKSIGKLLWHNDDNVIIENLRSCIDKNVSLILSELLPDELPRSVKIQEYNYFIKKYQFVPPIITDFKDDSSNINTENDIGILLDYSTILSKSEEDILSILKKISKTKSVKISITEINSLKNHNIFSVIANSNKIILATRNPHFELHCKIICKRLNKVCETLTTPSGSLNRYLALDIEYNFFLFFDKNKSLRAIVNNLLSTSNKSYRIKSFIDCIDKIDDSDNLLSILNRNESYKYFTKECYNILTNVNKIELTDKNFNYFNTFYSRQSLHDKVEDIESNILRNDELVKCNEFIKRKYIQDFISLQKDINWQKEFYNNLISNNYFLKQLLFFEKEITESREFESKIIEYLEYTLFSVKILPNDKNEIIQKTLKEHVNFIKKSNVCKRYQKLLFFIYETYKEVDCKLAIDNIYQMFSRLNEDKVLNELIPRIFKICSYIFDIKNMLYSINYFSNHYSDKSNLLQIIIDTNFQKHNVCLNSLAYSKLYQIQKHDTIDFILTLIYSFDENFLSNNKSFFYLPILFKKNITTNFITKSTDPLIQAVYSFVFWVNGLNALAESIFNDIKFSDDFDFSLKIRYYALNIIFSIRSNYDSLLLPESFTKKIRSDNFYSNCISSPIRLMDSLFSSIILYKLNDYDDSIKLLKNFLNNVNFKCETLLERTSDFLPKDIIKV